MVVVLDDDDELIVCTLVTSTGFLYFLFIQ